MQITFDFQDGDKPDIEKNSMEYFLVRSVSKYDGKVRVFTAFYLNEYPLEFEWGCSKCDELGDACPALHGDGCPQTGWFEDKYHSDYDSVYERITNPVIGFASMPKPQAA